MRFSSTNPFFLLFNQPSARIKTGTACNAGDDLEDLRAAAAVEASERYSYHVAADGLKERITSNKEEGRVRITQLHLPSKDNAEDFHKLYFFPS